MAAVSPEKTSTSQVLDDLDFQVHDQSGINWTYEQKSKLSQELRTFASKYLNPLPEYNCLARDFSTAFNDKLIVIARSMATGDIVAFTSTVYLSGFSDRNIPFVLHTGLTCIAENLRRNSMTIFLFYYIFKHLAFKYPEGYWLSNLAGVISSLGSITRYGINVYPSPSSREPSATQRLIASVIDLHHRDKMLISPDAIFDSERFVFRKSNGPDSCFRKHRDDVRYSDRHNTVNDYYRGLLGEDNGDEVLQVAFMDQRILISEKESRLEKLNDRWSKL